MIRSYKYIARLIFSLMLLYRPLANYGQEAGHTPWWPTATVRQYDTAAIKKKLDTAISIVYNYPDSARKIALAALHDSRLAGFDIGIAQALVILGKQETNTGLYDSAIRHLQQAIPSLLNSKRPVRIAGVIINIGNAYFGKGDYNEAINTYYRSLRAFETYGHRTAPNDSVQAYLNIALAWSKIGGTQQAIEALKKTETIAELHKDPYLLVQFYGNAGKVYSNNDAHIAIDYYRKGVTIAESENMNGEAVDGLNSIAAAYNFLKEPDSALYCLAEVKAILDQYPGAYITQHYHYRNQKGSALLLKKAYREAEQILQPLYNELKTATGNTSILIELEKNMTNLYNATGRYQLAAIHATNYAELKDTLYELQNSGATALWIKLRNTENNEALLKKEFRIAQQERDIHKKNFWILGIATVLLLLGLILFFYRRNYLHKQKIQSATILQMQTEQELSQLKAHIAGEEKERNRIAIELHDNVGGLLTTAIYNLQRMEQQPPQEYDLQKMDAIIKEVRNEIRNTSHKLMPDVLLQQDLAEAFIQYCAFVERDTGLHIGIQTHGPFDAIPKDVQLSYYRILQELLQNIQKHADASKVLVLLHAGDGLLSLTVEDDGKGFDITDSQKKGKGLKNIENRLKILNGHIYYDTTPGKGTSIYIETNLDDNDAAG